jgi:hypothetical protein
MPVDERLDGHGAKGTLRAMAPRLPAAAALAALALSAGGCGESDDQRVRDTLQRFGTATATKDYRALCRDLLARRLVARLRAVGLPCEQALSRALGPVDRPSLKVQEVKVSGNTALARITTTARGQRPSRDTIRLVEQDGSWRIAALSGNQPPSPPRDLAGDREH